MRSRSGARGPFAGARVTVSYVPLFVLSAILVLSACSERRPQPAPSPDSGVPASESDPSGETPPSEATPKVDPPEDPERLEAGLPDDSLPEKEYVRAGLPPPDRPWSGADMAKAAQVLKSFAAGDPRMLPRYGSKRSGAVFARIVSDDNLRPFRDSSQPLARRVPDALALMQSSNEILAIYGKAAMTVPGAGSEIVELQGSHLRCAALQILLVRELLPQLDRNDAQYHARIDAVEGIKDSLVTTVVETITTLTDRYSYSVAIRKRLIGYMSSTIPSILPELNREAQNQVLERLVALDSEPAWSELQPELGELTFAATQAVEAQ